MGRGVNRVKREGGESGDFHCFRRQTNSEAPEKKNKNPPP